MKKISIRFEGDAFNPKLLIPHLGGINIDILQTAGKKAKKGKYKGTISPSGLATIDFEYRSDLSTAIVLACRLIWKLQSFVDLPDITFSIDTSEDFNIEKETVSWLSDLNISLEFLKPKIK